MRRLGSPLALMLAVLLTTAVAQNNNVPAQPGAPQRHKAHAQQSGPHALPAKAEMYKMRSMIGEWTTTEKFEANELSPRAGTGTGKARLHWGPGRMSLLQNYRSVNNAFGNFDGHSVFFWDVKDSSYKTFWCDSMMGCAAQFGSGKWEGDKLIFTGEAESMGKKIAMRDTFSDIMPDSFTLSEEVSIDGGPMKHSMMIQYKKATTPAPAAKSEAR